MQARGQEDRLTRWPIQSLIWPFVVIVLLTGWFAVWARVDAERMDAEIAATMRAQERAILLEQHVVKTLQIAALTNRHLGDEYLTSRRGTGEAGDPAVDLIDDPLIAFAGATGAAIFDENGATVAASRQGKLMRGRDILAAQKIDGARNSGLAVSNPGDWDGTGQNRIVALSRIVRKGNLAGYVALSFEPRRLLNVPPRANFLDTDLVSIIGLNGITLARREGDRFSSGQDVRGAMVMREQLENPNGTYKGPSALDGHVRYFSHQRVEGVPIFVTAGVSYSDAIANVDRRAMLYFGVMGWLSLVGLLIAVVVRYEVNYRETKGSELTESMRRLREAQRIGKIGDWEYDVNTKELIWSDELCEMYERPPTDDVLSVEEFAKYLRPGEFNILEEKFIRKLKAAGSGSCEVQVTLPSGATSKRCITFVSVADTAGEITALVGTDQDISQTHLVRELEKQVAHLDRQGAMSIMAATLAHELNQPLTAASNYLTAALRAAVKLDACAGTSVPSGLRLALDQVHGAGEIIRRVRNMVQVESGFDRSAPVRKTIWSSIGLLKDSGFPGADDISVDVDDKLPDVLIAPVQLQQVLVNLIKNALEAVPAERPEVTVRASTEGGDQVRIEICDNGPGFPAELVDAFQAFHSDKEDGTGLGLSISRTIIEHHGGKLRVETSRPGETVVSVVIPCVPK